MFALKSPLSNGALLADEVGLGKTIEAGLVLAQYWAERKRQILLIVPASLRTQWRDELSSKFYIESTILESTNFNRFKRQGHSNPFIINNQVVICSFNFAANKEMELKSILWDLVIIDEAHRLRNVYKPNTVIASKLKKALVGRKKLLLTATPLQNNLMELYGLVSIIDDQVFGSAKTFQQMYVNAGSEIARNALLKKRLQPVCKRTLRKQVTEYIRYTNRLPMLQEYEPTKDEELLYNSISSYLQSEHLCAGRIKCIYIDPPYNTESAFEHYDDKLEHSTWCKAICSMSPYTRIPICVWSSRATGWREFLSYHALL